MLNIYCFLLIVMSATFVLLQGYWQHKEFVIGFMMMYRLLYVFLNIVFFAMAMQCCWKKVSATQFTLYMTISNLGRIAGAKLLGPAKSQFSWETSILVFTLLFLIVWIVIQFLQVQVQVNKIAELEEHDHPIIIVKS